MAQLNKFYQAFAKVQHRREVLIGRRSKDERDCFCNIVTSLSSRQCHDARDRIYSLWSMAPSFYKDCPLDYAIPEGVVFTSVFECMLREAKLSRGHLNNFLGWGIDYRVLQWMNFGPDSTNVNCRPSWVPDFSKSWSHEALHAHQGRIGFSKLYQPSGWSRGYVKVQGRQLHLKGFPMDKVRVVGKTVDDPTSPESLKKALSQWSCLLRESGFADKTTDVTFHEQLATLLCANIVAERMPDDQFAAWRRTFVAQRIWKVNILATIFEYAFNVIARSEHSRRLRAEECPGKQELKAVINTGDLKCFSDGRYRSAVSSSLNQRALYITDRGRIGLCLPQATTGDEIWGVYGFRVPFVFRASDGSGESRVHNMIGDCYLQGAMDGELLPPRGRGSTVVKLV
ncbi:HET-domain-containing protein [Colletotrichum asianum]